MQKWGYCVKAVPSKEQQQSMLHASGVNLYVSLTDSLENAMHSTVTVVV